ncbi:MAG TPA: DNA-directed RNA polymerase subunit beta [Chloroflexota bacterium]|nr:DNA-directed RNA polymerase subunit beta [Chloroflexota bacterium]
MALAVSEPQRNSRHTFARTRETLPMPNLIQVQLRSFHWFQTEGLRELFEEINPIQDYSQKMELQFSVPDEPFGKPKYTAAQCRDLDLTYAAPLNVRATLHVRETGEIIEKTIFMGDFPLMTPQGTFIINGSERVVVSQLVRSPGVYFTRDIDPSSGRPLYMAKVIPNRGAWLEFETSNKNLLTVKVDRKRKIPVTTLLRAIGYGAELETLFEEVDVSPDRHYIKDTLSKDSTTTEEGALIEMYKKLRPGDPPTRDNAASLIQQLFFNPRRYDLGRVGRYKLNKRLGESMDNNQRTLTKEDLALIVRRLIELNNSVDSPTGPVRPDDIDHLGNRRVRAVGELLQNQFRIGLLRMERVVKERMTIQDATNTTPSALINIRPVVAAVKEFFGGSQLSQFMDQTNPLAELTHKRRLSALGPGGLSRDRAGFDVRDVHPSHYGRVCPIETPEGPNIGLIGSLATYSMPNAYGFMETPYRKVVKLVSTHDEVLAREVVDEPVVDLETGEVLVAKGEKPSAAALAALRSAPARQVRIKPMVSEDVLYLTADEEEQYVVAQANVPLTPDGHFVSERITARHGDKFVEEIARNVDFMDVSPRQIVSVATAMIPFLEHDDANRALMGSNMQRQAVALVRPQAPIVGTGMEWQSARDSGQVVVSESEGVVVSATGRQIAVRGDDGEDMVYDLRKFARSNQGTCINQRPSVIRGQTVRKGDVLADSSSTDRGELALGQNVLVAFMAWEGGNYEDAIIMSDRMVREDVFTSIHMEKHEVDARDTKLGQEEITRDIPNVGEEGLKDLDERGIVRVGAEVGPMDILVGKITPKGETELTAEERLLRAIFGEKAREVKDTSLRVPQGERGKVVEVKVFKRDSGAELPPGVNQLVRVSIAQKRKISQGDKMAGRHGNKGVISRIVPIEDMPFLPDGTPIDIILNPLGVPSRMNIGQILETHLGWAAKVLGMTVASPVFEGATEEQIRDMLKRAGLPEDGKVTLYDGRSGEAFDQPITVGYIYMMKLAHLVEDKIHARSTGPYSLVTQQPLGGKAQFGGQRFGEMEVWALEAYGAAHILQELLTVKSDDVIGRVKTYESIVKGEQIMEPGVPESFKVLVKELQSLGLAVEVLNDDEEKIEFSQDAQDDLGLSDADFSELSRPFTAETDLLGPGKP